MSEKHAPLPQIRLKSLGRRIGKPDQEARA